MDFRREVKLGFDDADAWVANQRVYALIMARET
jgi:hypothetical protein